MKQQGDQMQREKELELLRKEMINLKDCITKYLGYVFAGSGAAVYGIGRMDKSIEHVMPAMAFGINSNFNHHQLYCINTILQVLFTQSFCWLLQAPFPRGI